MIAAPAVDLRGGRCVQLVGGVVDDERISLPDPVAQAVRWAERGFGTLHIVDLDAALGSGDNLDLILEIVEATPAETQVGGGIRDIERAEALLDAGVDRIIVGTRAVDDPEWLAALSDRWPWKVMIALDTKNGRILKKGWTEDSGRELAGYLPSLAAVPLAGVLCTDVGREGRMEGIDRGAARNTIRLSAHPLWASGGITTVQDLEYLAEHRAAGAVLGMALYTGMIDPTTVAERWGGAANTSRTVNER